MSFISRWKMCKESFDGIAKDVQGKLVLSSMIQKDRKGVISESTGTRHYSTAKIF